MSRLHARIGDRLLPDRDPLVGQGLPADSFVEAALRAAAAEADAHYREAVEPRHLLVGILSPEAGPAARLLAEVGATYARAREILQTTL
jgi:ATP-dependent Clp protease ATP-binding subunit ClpA